MLETPRMEGLYIAPPAQERVLAVVFTTCAEQDAFRKAAKKVGRTPEELAHKLLMDFVKTVQGPKS
jgi:hypothetical protein